MIQYLPVKVKSRISSSALHAGHRFLKTSDDPQKLAFKEAGILVHAYMIYGFWNDTPQSIVDSMETLRQFFAAGLLDSAFWHKFVLTRNSTVYNQWKKDGTLNLVSSEESSSAFARNNLHFKGEEKFNAATWISGDYSYSEETSVAFPKEVIFQTIK